VYLLDTGSSSSEIRWPRTAKQLTVSSTKYILMTPAGLAIRSLNKNVSFSPLFAGSVLVSLIRQRIQICAHQSKNPTKSLLEAPLYFILLFSRFQIFLFR